MAPVHGVTLTMTTPHPENALYQGQGGQAPSVTVQQMRADQASSSLPMGVRAAPGAAGGLSGPEYSGDYRTAPNEVGLPPMTTPERPGGAVVHYDRDIRYQIQHPAPDVAAPGSRYATRAPGDQERASR